MAASIKVLLGMAACIAVPVSSYQFPPSSASVLGLRASSRPPAGVMREAERQIVRVSRRAAVMLPLLPAFAGKVQAKGDANLSFGTEISGSEGKGIDIAFTYPTSWKLEEKPGPILVTEETVQACGEDPDQCEFGEIIARSIATGDNALVLAAETDGDLEDLDFSFFKKTVFSRGGKFGAYGAPEDVKALKDVTSNGVRTIEVKWNTFTPGGNTLAKRSVISAVAIDNAVYMLVCSTSAKSYKASEPTLRAVAASWSAKATGKAAKKPAKIEGVKKSMFRKQNEERKAIEAEREAEGIY